MIDYVFDVKGEKCSLIYIKNFIDNSTLERYREILDKEDRWREGETSYGKEIRRLQIWCQEEGKYFNSSWRGRYDRWESQDYNDDFFELQKEIQVRCKDMLDKQGIKIPGLNSLLINKYRDGNDTIKPHRDNKVSFGEKPVVFIVSIGDSRKLNFEPVVYNDEKLNSCKLDKSRITEKVSIELEDGSLFIMAGYTQKHFVHSIDRELDKGVRYSLTYREHIG